VLVLGVYCAWVECSIPLAALAGQPGRPPSSRPSPARLPAHAACKSDQELLADGCIPCIGGGTSGGGTKAQCTCARSAFGYDKTANYDRNNGGCACATGYVKDPTTQLCTSAFPCACSCTLVCWLPLLHPLQPPSARLPGAGPSFPTCPRHLPPQPARPTTTRGTAALIWCAWPASAAPTGPLASQRTVAAARTPTRPITRRCWKGAVAAVGGGAWAGSGGRWRVQCYFPGQHAAASALTPVRTHHFPTQRAPTAMSSRPTPSAQVRWQQCAGYSIFCLLRAAAAEHTSWQRPE
jgi:hypothetical protein